MALFETVFSTVLSWFDVKLLSSFSGFGRNLIDGLIGDIQNAWELAKPKVNELGDGIKSWFKEKLGIKSASQVFLGFGVNIVERLSNGLEKTKAIAKTVVQSMDDQMIAAMPEKITAPKLDTHPTLAGLAKLASVTQKDMDSAVQKMQARRDTLLGKTTPKTTALGKPKARKASAPVATQFDVNAYVPKPVLQAEAKKGF